MMGEDEHRCDRCGKILSRYRVICEECEKCQHVWVFDRLIPETEILEGSFVYRCVKCGAYRRAPIVNRQFLQEVE